MLRIPKWLSLRADIVMHKAARALAALEGRSQVTPEDVRGAAELVLPHRRRRKPFEQPGLDKDQLDELMQQALQPPDESESGAEDTEQENNQDNGESQANNKSSPPHLPVMYDA